MIVRAITYLLRGFSLLVAVVIVAFSLAVSAPIDPVQSYIGSGTAISPEQRENIIEYWGLDEPPIERFTKWLNHAFHGDLGTSMTYRQDVGDVIGEKFIESIVLMVVAWLLAGVLGIVIGLVMGAYSHHWLGRVLKSICYTLTAVPSFYLGILLLLIFAVYLSWFPIGLATPIGLLNSEVSVMDRIQHMILPALCLSMVSMPAIALHTRAKLIEALHSDYAQYARARGESEKSVILRHCLRNSILPAAMLQFASFSELFGGSVLVEQVFSYPGLGNAAVRAGTNGDIPLLLGITIFSALFVFIGNALGDLFINLADPRIRLGRDRNG